MKGVTMTKKRRRKGTSTEFIYHLIVLVITVALLTDTVTAIEIDYPVSCYTSDELIKVREWEKTWVEKK